MPRIARVAGLWLMVCCLTSGGASLLARVDAAGDVRAADSIVYQAIASRDGARLADLLDDAFVLTNTFGDVYDKVRFLQACCAGEALSKTLLLGATESQVKVYGNAAVMAARTEMRFMKDNQEQKLSWRSTRMYVKAGSKWKLAAEQRTTVD